MIELKLAPFYPVLDTSLWARIGIPVVDAAEAILDGGARLMQFRHKGHFSRQVYEQAQRVAEMCAVVEAMFVVNDRADIAVLLDAGLHVGQDDVPPRDVRKILPRRLPLGFSTHTEAQLLEAAGEPTDYLALGPVFQTASKENPDPVVGLKEFTRLRALISKPLVAIGGITSETALRVLQAGADSVAVIGGLVPEEHTKSALRKRTEAWVQLLKT